MKQFITSNTSIAPLAVFRVLFGFIMLVSTIRFALRGWIYELYVEPDFYFTFYGFDWVQPLGEYGMYALFFIVGLSALFIMLGYQYRIASVLFFLAFTYIELIDKTNYLNHYYFVSIIGFLLILVPANRSFSLDALRKPGLAVSKVPAWTINIFKLQLGLVYFFAGLAKLNGDWLLNAMPLKIWLPANSHLPVIGEWLTYPEAAYLLSWAGAFYDLTIVFFLLYKPTRIPAYATVIFFHLMTYALFQIGMFPFIMILTTLIFFSPEFHSKLIDRLKHFFSMVIRKRASDKTISYSGYEEPVYRPKKNALSIVTVILTVHFLLQLVLPFRYALYPGNLFWTEQGYRFSWRVMLMEKAGYASFTVHDTETGNEWQIPNWEYLTPNQEKMMSTQPDMILQFAHHLKRDFTKKGIQNIKVTVESYVTLNGRPSRLFIDPDVDLANQKRGFKHKQWILPYNES